MSPTELKSEKKICGIIGNPLGHTLSPAMHNAAFKELGLSFEYLAFEISENELADTLKMLKAKGFRGLSVTHPFKIKVMRYLDFIHESADKIKAVNTIVNDFGELKGFNTDSYGALEALKKNDVDLESSSNKILILGAGGAARAVAFSLARFGCDITIANRTLSRGVELAVMLNKITSSTAIELSDVSQIIAEVKILINCTSVGMKGGFEESPISTDLIRGDMTVFDTVYSPKDTPLLKAAKKSGAKIVYGYDMFISQGVKAFELWTGEKAPISLMRKIVCQELDAN